MILAVAAICFSLAIFLYWKILSLDQDPNIPGPVSHVIIPAVAYPIIILLSVIALAALVYSLFV
jgi:hypothetical protein